MTALYQIDHEKAIVKPHILHVIAKISTFILHVNSNIIERILHEIINIIDRISRENTRTSFPYCAKANTVIKTLSAGEPLSENYKDHPPLDFITELG